MKVSKAFAWVLLAGVPLYWSFSYLRETLRVDACLDSGGSFDYLRMICDREANHTFVPYSERYGGLIVASLLALFIAAAYLIVTSGMARSHKGDRPTSG